MTAAANNMLIFATCALISISLACFMTDWLTGVCSVLVFTQGLGISNFNHGSKSVLLILQWGSTR